MLKIIAIVKLGLLNMRKNRAELIMLVVFPLLFTFVFGKAFGGGETSLPVSVTDLDNSYYSKAIIRNLKEANKNLKVSTVNQQEAIDSVKNKMSEMTIIIPKGFGTEIRRQGKVSIETISVPNSNSAIGLKQMLSAQTNRLEADATAATETVNYLKEQQKLTPDRVDTAWENAYKEADKKWTPEPPMTVQYQEASDKTVVQRSENKFNNTSLGFSVAFVMVSLMYGAGTILESRQIGTWGRILSTPTRPSQILAGNLISTFIIGWIQMLILILAGKYLFGVNWGANLGGLVILMSAYLFSVIGMGLMLAGFVKTYHQHQILSSIVMNSLSMLGGAFWPVEWMPKVMQTISNFIPTGQVMKGLLDLVARGKSLGEIQQPIYILILMGFIFFVIGLKRVKFD